MNGMMMPSYPDVHYHHSGYGNQPPMMIVPPHAPGVQFNQYGYGAMMLGPSPPPETTMICPPPPPEPTMIVPPHPRIAVEITANTSYKADEHRRCK